MLLFAPGPGIAQEPAAPDLDSILDSPPFHNAFWGVLVTGPDGEVLFERNADRLFIPASSTKLVVAAAAAAMFEPDFTVTTDVYGTGPISDGVLQGDLVVRGHGDPSFAERCYGPDPEANGACDEMWSRLDALADSVATLEFNQIAGSIVGDGSFFEATLVHPGWSSYDLNWWYAAPVSGLGFNDNSINVTWGPGARPGAPAVVSFEPDMGDFVFENRTRTVDPEGRTNVDFFRVPGTRRIWAEGSVAADRSDRTEYFSVYDPNRYFVTALRVALERRGISVAGPTESTTDPLRFAYLGSRYPLARFHSRELPDLIDPILRSSQNWFAELLLKNLGAHFGEEGSWRAGVEVESAFLIDSVGVDSTAFELHDGSGLSAANVVTPRAFIQLLDYMENHDRNAPFMRALPRSGGVGSLRRRFIDTPLEGRVVAKTGSINHVNTLNGYVETDRGNVKFSVMVNNQTGGGRAASRTIDSFLVALLGR